MIRAPSTSSRWTSVSLMKRSGRWSFVWSPSSNPWATSQRSDRFDGTPLPVNGWRSTKKVMVAAAVGQDLVIHQDGHEAELVRLHLRRRLDLCDLGRRTQLLLGHRLERGAVVGDGRVPEQELADPVGGGGGDLGLHLARAVRDAERE